MYVTVGASPLQMKWRAQVQYPTSGAGEVPPPTSPPNFSGSSSGCLGCKLVIAQDAAQSIADLRMQRLCPSTNRRGGRTSNQSVNKRLKRPAQPSRWAVLWMGTHWLGRPPPHSLDSLVASLLRASPGAQPWVTRTERKKKKKRRGMEGWG